MHVAIRLEPQTIFTIQGAKVMFIFHMFFSLQGFHPCFIQPFSSFAQKFHTFG